jgi:membrane protease YdiL (CAAX protease family)
LTVEPTSPSLRSEIWIASIGILVVLGLLKHGQGLIPVLGDHAGTIAAGIQLYVPILLIGRYGITREKLGWTLEHASKDFRLAAVLSLATIIPFALGHHYWQTLFNGRVFELGVPSEFAYSILVQFLVVALPEELFFRGYLLQRMEMLWPSRKGFWALGGRAVLLSSLVFGLAHFVGEYRIDRLATFFPGIAFAYLRLRTGRLLAPVTYHAFCNLLSELIFASYRSSPNI